VGCKADWDPVGCKGGVLAAHHATPKAPGTTRQAQSEGGFLETSTNLTQPSQGSMPA